MGREWALWSKYIKSTTYPKHDTYQKIRSCESAYYQRQTEVLISRKRERKSFIKEWLFDSRYSTSKKEARTPWNNIFKALWGGNSLNVQLCSQ